mgnify:CR=1 FL=1
MTCPACGYRPRRCSRCLAVLPERRAVRETLATFGAGIALTGIAWAGLVLWFVAGS